MQAEASLSKDLGQVAFFVGNLCQEADLVYRFGYTLTLSEVAAQKLLLETYQSILGRLDKLLEGSSQEIRFELVKAAWSQFQGWSETYDETSAEVLKLFQGLPIEIRVVLVVVDALGFSPEETASLLDLKEIELRRYLAEGRKKMIGFDV